MSVLAWLAGLGLAGAAGLAWSGFNPPEPTALRPRRRWALPADLRRRLVLAVAGAAVLGLVTRWPVAALAGAAAGYFGRDLLSPKVVRHAPIERTEAVAEWTEQLRDTMAAAAGLQQAIAATAPLAPIPIRPQIADFAARAQREPLVPLLEELAKQLADPTADLVITALALAASGEAQDLGEVLSALAVAARDDATMRRYVDASRARTRTGVRIITAIAIASLLGLLLFGQGYLAPYSSATGQLMLAAVLACFAGGIGALARMAADAGPERLLAQRSEAAQ